jgi:uncharacterized membrane protein
MSAPPRPPIGTTNHLDHTNQASRAFWPLMLFSLGGLIVLCVLWEAWLAPLRPGSFLLSLKALPLLLPLRGAIRRKVYTIQWSSMLIWLYFIEGVVRGFRNPDPMTSWLAWLEVALVVLFFISAILFLRPYKQEAKAAAKATAAAATSAAATTTAATSDAATVQGAKHDA